MSGRLQGHHAVVTGGAQGIGLAIARRFLDEGANVSLWDIGERPLQAATATLNAPGRVFTAVTDVRDEAAVYAAAEASAAALGPATVLVNNAGVLGPLVPTWEHSFAQWRTVLDINLTGAFLCSRALVPAMLADLQAQRAPALGRRVVNIASVAGKEGNGLNAAYSASKAGLIALTKSLGKELAGAGVLVNCITPSAAETAVFDGVPTEHRAQLHQALLSRVPMARFVEPAEVAAMAAWLASADCSFSTGAVFDISGGRSLY
ncbi:3-oxoacyl-[acyl-carrier protein] reductase [Acidovorax soli]|uniref:3-oxoacyl-[acyl-carrier protein] reductase n=1 Tax=Acidovorax soli TaxID=592050 RepID=A0A7X0PFJ1_9BURK|nr:SDR family NAD(P)-dependent oxidoreductase [Acidovorax soli]MBB6561033.1 3-oxoacyl-[acyl-carrier protein] reductase [Acidovorax soli]